MPVYLNSFMHTRPAAIEIQTQKFIFRPIFIVFRWINLLQSWTLTISLFKFNVCDTCVREFHECNRNCVCELSSTYIFHSHERESVLQMNSTSPDVLLFSSVLLIPELLYSAAALRRSTPRRAPLAIRVCVCLSMSILLTRDMFPSPRKLPQARNTTPAPANNPRLCVHERRRVRNGSRRGSSLIYR